MAPMGSEREKSWALAELAVLGACDSKPDGFLAPSRWRKFGSGGSGGTLVNGLSRPLGDRGTNWSAERRGRTERAGVDAAALEELLRARCGVERRPHDVRSIWRCCRVDLRSDEAFLLPGGGAARDRLDGTGARGVVDPASSWWRSLSVDSGLALSGAADMSKKLAFEPSEARWTLRRLAEGPSSSTGSAIIASLRLRNGGSEVRLAGLTSECSGIALKLRDEPEASRLRL
jgi:hypothetical protein